MLRSNPDSVVEEGVHGDLMQKKGVYYKLNEAQIQNVA